VLQHYFLLAFRNLRRAPLASVVSILTLTLGLVCIVTAFAFVSFWERAERHFANADRIAVLTTNLSIPGLITFTDDPGTPEQAAAYLDADFPELELVARAIKIDEHAAIASGDRAVRANVVAVDPDFLEVFNLPFTAGNPRAAFSVPGSAVITEQQASALFGSDNPIGRTLLVENTVEATITGVLGAIPEPSHLGRSASASLSFDVLVSRDVLEKIRTAQRDPNAPIRPENWLGGNAFTYILLPRDGSFSLDHLRAELSGFTKRHVPEALGGFAAVSFSAVSARSLLSRAVDDELFFSTSDLSVAAVLLVLGMLVLGVACLNYANLAIARAASRLREVGLRKALGATPAQIMAQHLLEASVLATVALITALVSFRLLQPAIDSLAGADLTAIVTTGPAFGGFLIALLILVTFMAGTYPALALARSRPMLGLHASRTQIGPKILSSLLVGGQFAVASFLLIAVAVTTLQNRQFLRTALGSTSDPLLLIENPSDITHIETITLRNELTRLPQITGVTEIGNVPWESLGGTAVSSTPGQDAVTRGALSHTVGYEFFSVFAISVLAGRVFTPERFATDFPDFNREQPSAQPRAIVVDRAFASEFGFASPQAAIDQIVYFPERTMSAFGLGAQPLRIIGVVENQTFGFFGSSGSVAITMYQLQQGLRFQVARIRADDVSGALAQIDATWRRLTPNVAIRRRFLDDVFEEQYTTFVRVSTVFSAVSFMAFLISVSGLFAMAAFVTGRRRREIGVRKTHGASTWRIVTMPLVSFARPVIVGSVLAWPFAYFAARSYLDVLLRPIDLTWLPFMFSLATTAAIALLAVGGKTLAAARTRPGDVLRYE
jgi:putative ABC transport system permease protein